MQRYKTMKVNGETYLGNRDDDRCYTIRELTQFVAFDIVNDYNDIVDGKKKLAETNMELAIKVLNAISKAM